MILATRATVLFLDEPKASSGRRHQAGYGTRDDLSSSLPTTRQRACRSASSPCPTTPLLNNHGQLWSRRGILSRRQRFLPWKQRRSKNMPLRAGAPSFAPSPNSSPTNDVAQRAPACSNGRARRTDLAHARLQKSCPCPMPTTLIP